MDTFSNFATSVLAGGAGGVGTALAATDTSLVVNAGDGSKFPTTGPFMLLLGTPAGTHELAKCASRSGDTLSGLSRGQEGTAAALWVLGTSVEQVVTAGNMANLWTNSRQSFNIRGYGAKVDGATDDTSAWQAAIAAAQSAGGGVIFHPGGNSIISSTLTVTSDSIQFAGIGRGSQITAAGSFPAAPMIWVQGPGGSNFRHGVALRDLLIVCNGPTGVTGIQLDSTYYGVVERVDVEGIYATSIKLNGTSSAFGAYTHIRDCHLGPVPGGGGSAGTGVISSNHEHWTIDSCTLNWFNLAGGCAIKSTSSACSILNNDFDDCDTALWLYFCQLNRVIGNNFDRGLTRFIYLNGCNNCRVLGNDFDTFVGTGSQDALYLDNNAADNLITGNNWQPGTTWTNAIHDNANSGKVNYYQSNDVGGLAVVPGTGIYRNNVGYNPRGHAVSQPAVPASTTPQTNTTGVDCTVFVTGGTVSAVAIGGTNTGLTSGAFRVAANQTITLTYSAAPTWQWFGD